MTRLSAGRSQIFTVQKAGRAAPIFPTWIALAFGLATAAMPTGSAWGQTDWRGLRTSDLPARVKAIVGLPATIDLQNCATWGRWTVCFGGQSPIATYRRGQQFPLIDIGPLRCNNPVVEDLQCSMTLTIGGPVNAC